MKIPEVIITSGGTISKIDDVRHIGNFSSGTTGAQIAEEFLRRGFKVHFVYNRNSKRPFRRNMVLNPEKSLGEEIQKLQTVYAEFRACKENLHEYPIETFEEYLAQVRELLTTKSSITAIVLAAAVSDYGIQQTKGKISSDQEGLTIHLSKNPKVISLIKQWNPQVFQVGFKLLSRVPFEELIEVAYKHMLQNNSDLTVANTTISGDFAQRRVAFVTPSGEVAPVELKDLPSELAQRIYNATR